MDINELIASITTKPKDFGFWGDDENEVWWQPGGWGFTPIGTHRDADSVTQSNWQVITEDLIERFPDSFKTYHTNHWAVGWYDHLAVNTSDLAAVEALNQWLEKLKGYPVADEDNLGEIEYEEICESIDSWAYDEVISCYEKATDSEIEPTEDQKDAIKAWLSEQAEHSGTEVHFPGLSALHKNDPTYWAYEEALEEVEAILTS